MSHIEFGGYGTPMPDIAIPDPHVSDHLPTQVLELTEEGFDKTDWVALGYTNYEVWCVGAAGGLGGGIFEDSDVHWAIKDFVESATTTVWNNHLAQMAAGDAYLGKNYYTDYYTTIYSQTPMAMPAGYISRLVPGSPGWLGAYAYDVTHHQADEAYNPTHLLPVQQFVSEFTRQSGYAFGGAGGGGGLHVVSGLLEDLDDVTEVVIGMFGTDAPPGHIHSNGLWTPSPPIIAAPTSDYSWYVRSSVSPQIFSPPGYGGDGGASSFGDVAVASGGKGGHPATQWLSGALYLDGAGGEGGLGGRSAAGGGGAGGDAMTADKQYNHYDGYDGSWDGTVGGGGGGGRGATSNVPPVQQGPLLGTV
jgi:hypothetical protein